MKLSTELIDGITIARFRRMESVIDFSPPYQRESGVWTKNVREMLIDSVVNGLDMPKLYFERLRERRHGPGGTYYQYAVIDGKQRLTTIVSFLADELRLAPDFIYFADENVNAGGMTFSDLEREYPSIAREVSGYLLDVVAVVSDSGDLVEEMFQRLNSSSSLNAAEKRNSVLGPTRDAVNALAEHEFLVKRSPIKNARYKYRELAAKFLAIEHQIAERGKVSDTKADTLYRLFEATKGERPKISKPAMDGYREDASEVLARMSETFDDNDQLLGSIGTVVVYYLVFRQDAVDSIQRQPLARFEALRREASQGAPTDQGEAHVGEEVLRVYNGLVQSTNDGSALQRRAEILEGFLRGYDASDELAGLTQPPE